jgi:phenylalanyl-tRNA synthetase beta chain
VQRDLAVIVEESVAAERVEAAIRNHAGPLLVGLRLFDIYRGRPLGATEKSLAYRLDFQAADRTLTEAEVDSAVAAITDGLAGDVGGRLRT